MFRMDALIVSGAAILNPVSRWRQTNEPTRKQARIASGRPILTILGENAHSYYDRLIATIESSRSVPVPEETASIRSLKVTKSVQLTPGQARALEESAAREGVAQQTILARGLANELSRLNKSAWTTVDDDSSYDPGRFYTFAADTKGHSAEIRVRIPVPMRAEIQRLIEMGVIPEYQTAQHVARDAIYHRVKQLSRQVEDGELERVVDMAMMMSVELELRAKATEAEQLIRVMQENLQALHNHAVQVGDFTRIKEYLAERSDQSGLIPESHRVLYEDVLADWKKKLKNR